MGADKLRHVIERKLPDGTSRYFWQPSKTVRALGMSPEPLGADSTRALARAAELNALSDVLRRSGTQSSNAPLPGSMSKLFREFKASDEFEELKPRTKRDYSYYLDKIEHDFGRVMVRSLAPKIIKTYYKRVRRDVGVTWGYHILSTLRTVLSWAVSEDWIDRNPALDVKMKSPPKRTVMWTREQAATYIPTAQELGWHSIVAMAHVFDSIGQSPVDVRTLLRRSYDGRAIDVKRAKTGATDAPIPLFPEAIKALDNYLATQPSKLPDAPLFTNDKIGGMWNESTLQKKHAQIRTAAGLPQNLQLQDFRTTALTEGGAASATVDELRGLARHSTRDAAEHYVYPTGEFVKSIQRKRLAHRNKKRQKV